MHEYMGRGWKHPGRRSSDYGRDDHFDHDRRTYAAAENHYGKGPKGYTRKDENIREEVCETLFWNPEVDASEIDVNVKNHVVFLDGYVDSRHAKKMAERVVESISGVEDVFNTLKIKPYLDLQSDKIIARGEDGLFTSETIEH